MSARIPRRLVLSLLLPLAAALLPAAAPAQPTTLTMASTTSTEQSGLFGHLLPEFTKATGIEVKVVAVGTGQALDMGRRGDADVLFVHDQAAEEKFVAEGHGLAPRRHVQRLRAGRPEERPGQRPGTDIVAALGKLAEANAPFVSRGDKSGTHAAELRYWKLAGVEAPAQVANYKECGCGMGPALNIAAPATPTC